MDSSQLFNLLKELQEKADSAFSALDILALTEIKDKLLEIETSERFHFKQFVDDFKSKLFKSGIGLGKALDNYYIEPITPTKEKPTHSRKTSFEETFNLVIKCLKFELEKLKNYYFFTLNSDSSQNYDLLILHDKDYFVNPYKNCLQNQFGNITVATIDEFYKIIQTQLISGKTDLKNYICLLLLKTKMNAPSDVKNCNDSLKQIMKLFDSAESILFQNAEIIENNFIKKTLASKNFLDEDFFDEIEYLTSTFLTNAALLYEEEKIIKLLFNNFNCPLLEYKLLKSGNSGANVIEIRPKQKINSSDSKRFIVKYRKLHPTKKLSEEAKKFNEYIGGFEGFPGYTCNHQKTFTHEGILYSYAKGDYEEVSFPFSSILKKQEDEQPKNPFHEDAPNLIDKLFNIEVFQHWEKAKETQTEKVKTLFEPFIKLDVYDKIQEMLDITNIELENLELIKNFDKIIDYELTTKTKVCHGDLHTDNFFVDNKNIYLIDFGFTQFLPQVIDHAFLEASIKFNHIPRFIELDLLKKLENELLDDETFSAEYKFKSSNRKDLKYYLDIIHRIRVNAGNLLPNDNKLEYLISLFIVTFKLIKYYDLNQLYALNSATILSREIVSHI